MSLLALVPSRNRPAQAAEALASFMQTRRDPASRLVFVLDDDDPTIAEYPAGHVHVVKAKGYMGGALQQAATDRALLGDATSVGMAGDDNRFLTPGWDVTLDAWLTQNIGIAYGDDGFQHEKLPTCWWLSRPIVDRMGLAHPELRHFYMDNYWLELGRATGCLRYFGDVLIEHLHPLAHKNEWDAIYTRGHTNAQQDRRWFHRWKARGIKQDVAVLRGILDSGRPRKVLADWHHPSLWESLRILFEDRFGWQLYSPIGMEWAKDVWKFKRNGWAESDFLTFPDAVPVDGHYERSEPEYPEHPRKLVTLEQAAGMRWDFVLASVSIHQRTFGRYAQQHGARFIHQVGNAVHPIDRSVPQIILASSAAAGRGALPYHQEFDRSLFAYSPPTEPERVTSFMLRLDTYSCDYRWLSEAKGVRWSVVGGGDTRREGYKTPMSAVADDMRQTGWVWQDKRIGDGYGFVVHQAAAMGRPLIGHAAHYKGQLAEPFWRDLETCIDLDKHSPERALRLWRAISQDRAWHRDMAAEMAATFEATVDFGAEAEAIRAALTSSASGAERLRRSSQEGYKVRLPYCQRLDAPLM